MTDNTQELPLVGEYIMFIDNRTKTEWFGRVIELKSGEVMISYKRDNFMCWSPVETIKSWRKAIDSEIQFYVYQE